MSAFAGSSTSPAPAAIRGWPRSRCRRVVNLRPAGADQRGVRHGQTGRPDAVPSLPPGTRRRLHRGHSRQQLRPPRPLRPARFPRHPRPPPPDARRQAPRRSIADRLGDGAGAARVRLFPRPGGRLPVRDAPLRGAGADQPRRRPQPVDRGIGRGRRRGGRLSRPAGLRRRASPTGCRSKDWTPSRSADSAGRRPRISAPP